MRAGKQLEAELPLPDAASQASLIVYYLNAIRKSSWAEGCMYKTG